MAQLGDSSASLVLPLDASLSALVMGPVRSYLRLYPLARSTSAFILQSVEKASRRLLRKPLARPGRVRLTLKSRQGQVQVALSVSATPRGARLASLTRGAPPLLQARYRAGRRGGTLTFVSLPPRGV